VNYIEYFLYCFAVVIMIATPGPVMLLVASAGLKGGYRRALQTIFGTNLASLVLIAASIAILKGFLTISEQWFNVVKVLGCLYIVYLGIQILREVWQGDVGTESASGTVANGGFKQGFLVAISNPKDIIFFASFFPQFVQITPNLNLSLGILTVSWIALDFATLSCVYLMFNRFSRSKMYQHLLACCGVILIVVALYGIYATLF
jgi:threonine/homoserine/homoserine lactone efflux protein